MKSHIYLGNTPWAWGSGEVTINYEHTDALGSIVAESNATGAVVKRNAYAPYGEAYGATSIDRIRAELEEAGQHVGLRAAEPKHSEDGR